MFHDAEGELCQKLLTTDNISGTHLTSITSETIHAETQKKYFCKPIFNGEWNDILLMVILTINF